MIMDSGSLQSSSDEEEYDSRATVSLFTTAHPPPPYSAFAPDPQPPPPLFDPLPNYMNQNPNSPLFNQPMSWHGTTSLRSDPNSSNTTNRSNPMLSVPSFQTPPAGEDNPRAPVAPTAVRNTKKRSRASRRAPTTVLTTDTNNFRAMVQEFTGIPAQPFDNPSFKRSRLDLFGSRSTQPPPLPFLPFSTSTAMEANNNPAPNPNHFDVQNPLLSSLLQSNPKFMFSNSSSNPHNQSSFEIPSNGMKIGGLMDEFGLADGSERHVSGGLPNLISPDAKSWKKDAGDKEGREESWVCCSEKK